MGIKSPAATYREAKCSRRADWHSDNHTAATEAEKPELHPPAPRTSEGQQAPKLNGSGTFLKSPEVTVLSAIAHGA